jgi:7-cyano-7-deazaguanine synthase in queuosine biosynthesis
VKTLDPAWAGRHQVDLDSISHNRNVNIRFEDVVRKLEQNISPRLMDFLEIASYVFTADCSTQRGNWTNDKSDEPWGRDLAFLIAVREPEFWATQRVKDLIQGALRFLSNDSYSFQFVPLEVDRNDQTPYFNFDDQNKWPFYKPDRVLMFSGGLDSLAGIVETAASGGKAILISHRPVSTLSARQRTLFVELQKKFPSQLIHVPVWINKDEGFGRESTQRTRSFLFAALGTLVAQSIDAGGIRFYENGVLSVNLPVAEEVLRARASRTTHPVALHLLSSLAAAVTERELPIDNPFLFKTKTEVVQILSAHDATDLIAQTCSCSHLIFQSGEKRHCGRCSQCIDRRFAVAGAGLLQKDPGSDYVSDVFIGRRPKQWERSIAIDYTRHGIELERRSDVEIAANFNAEISRAVRYERKGRESAENLIAMYKRHGTIVRQILEEQLRFNAPKLIDHTLEETSLLALAIGQDYLPAGERRAAAIAYQDAGEKSDSGGPQDIILKKLDEIVTTLGARVSIQAQSRMARAKPSFPTRRDTILFAAIVRDLEGLQYCIFLDKHRVKPKWSEDGPKSYRESYLASGSYKKKAQDEKSRAKQRMNRFVDSVLAEAFITYLPDEFDKLGSLLNSRNSRDASKNPTAPKSHKH